MSQYDLRAVFDSASVLAAEAAGLLFEPSTRRADSFDGCVADPLVQGLTSTAALPRSDFDVDCESTFAAREDNDAGAGGAMQSSI